MELYVAGRATSNVKGKQIPVNEIVVDTAKKWIHNNMRYLDVENHIKIIPKIRSGSNELVELFQRFGKGEAPLANDSSFGVGYYPYSILEKNVLDIATLLNKKDTKGDFPFVGEDIKVMGVCMSEMTKMTIAIAMVDKFTADINSYKENIEKIKSFIKSELKLSNCEIFINTADDVEKESIYLTVTGTSAEGGDDGQVGRGNRVNGLITPYRPMSLEAYSGKNPVSHVGKIYNLFSYELSRSICENKYAEEAQVYIVSQIGKPITEPQILHIKLKNKSVDFKLVENLCKEMLGDIPNIWKRITGLNDFT
jgi:S-adenosylmethionine synthetase